jgi:hypothetical protein
MKLDITGIKLLCLFWWKIILHWLQKLVYSLQLWDLHKTFVLLYTEVQSNLSTTILGLVSGALLTLKGGQDNAVTYSDSLQSEQSRDRIPVEVHLASCKEVLSLSKGVKWPGCGADHQSLSSAQNANGLELYLWISSVSVLECYWVNCTFTNN